MAEQLKSELTTTKVVADMLIHVIDHYQVMQQILPNPALSIMTDYFSNLISSICLEMEYLYLAPKQAKPDFYLCRMLKQEDVGTFFLIYRVERQFFGR